MISLFAPQGVPEVESGDNLAELVTSWCQLRSFDVVVITSKVVSKAENRVVALDPSDDSALERLVVSESKRILRRRGKLLITETHHGFVCANAGVDVSNVKDGFAVLLPKDPDLSARRIQKKIQASTGLTVGIIISDTFGRTWRRGVCDIAIGCAGIAGTVDLRGTKDSNGRTLLATEIAVADEIAGAAELAKKKSAQTPFVVVRGLERELFRSSSVKGELIRDPSEDLFR